MADLNRASLMGRLGADPEIRQTQSGEKVANIRIATGEQWKDRNTGEKRERTEWHSVVIWGPLAGVAERFLKKGNRVLIEGNIRTRKWQDQSGQDRYSTEIVVSGFGARLDIIDWPEGSGGAARGQDDSYGGGNMPPNPGDSYGGGQGGGYGDQRQGGPSRDIDDEIPF